MPNSKSKDKATLDPRVDFVNLIDEVFDTRQEAAKSFGRNDTSVFSKMANGTYGVQATAGMAQKLVEYLVQNGTEEQKLHIEKARSLAARLQGQSGSSSTLPTVASIAATRLASDFRGTQNIQNITTHLNDLLNQEKHLATILDGNLILQEIVIFLLEGIF